MNEPGSDVDSVLKSVLPIEPLADGVFAQRVMDRMGRRRRLRRALLTVAGAGSAAIALATFPSAPAAWAAVTPASLAALTLLVGISSLAWTSTAE